ncbi:MAG TPA: cytochrome P450 [Polyangiaceae bacterium]|jgi:cytochrome P450
MTMSEARSTDRARSTGAQLPPRIPGTPLLGHLLAFRSDRAAVQLRTARSHPDVALMRMGVFDVLLVSSPHLAHDILQTQEDVFSKSLGLSLFLRPLLGDGLLTSERELHARQRRLIAPAFTLKRIAGYADTMAERASQAVASWREGETFDAAEVMMRLTLEIVGKTLFDAEVGSDAEAVGEALTKVMSNMVASLSSILPMPPAVPTRRNLDSRRATAQLDAIIYRLIAERRMAPADRGDVLSMLLAAQDEDGTVMTDRQIRDESMTLFLAGHETTANALSWALYLLGRNPDVRARAEQEARSLPERDAPLRFEDLKQLPFTLAVLKEAMRLYPPAYVIGRRSLRDVVLAGGDGGRRFHVKKHTNVLVNVLGIHRRADAFADPERFDPARFLGDREKELPRCAYMPFGAGPRVCIGNHFALMEGHLLLATILRSARLDLVAGARDIGTEPLVTLRPRGGVPVRVSKGVS